MNVKINSHFVVRYADTDRMKRVYYSKYLEYFEVGRTDFLKSQYISYKELEDNYKIFMPVIETYIKYIAPIEYDDKLLLTTELEVINKAKFKFSHILYKEEKVMAEGFTVHVFINEHNKLISFNDFVNTIKNC